MSVKLLELISYKSVDNYLKAFCFQKLLNSQNVLSVYYVSILELQFNL